MCNNITTSIRCDFSHYYLSLCGKKGLHKITEEKMYGEEHGEFHKFFCLFVNCKALLITFTCLILVRNTSDINIIQCGNEPSEKV